MKTIYINENALKILRESILAEELPEEIINIVFKNETSLKNNPALPNIFNEGFLEKLVKKRFKETKEALQDIGEINDVSETKMEDVLNKLIIKCQELEKPFRNELERLCYNFVIDYFEVPSDMVELSIALVDEVDTNKQSIKIEPLIDDTFEYENLEDASELKSEVYKRRLLNVLSMGAGMKLSSNIKSYMSEIYNLNPRLLDLYRKIIALNDYLLFTNSKLEITEDNQLQMGTVEVTLGSEDEVVRIDSQGLIFPILLSETVRGFMELFASHGLPKEKNKMEFVIGNADYLKAEPWDMRLGFPLWEIFSETFTQENVKGDLIPYLYMILSELKPNVFNKVMSEIFARTRKGKRLLGKLIVRAKDLKAYNNFDNQMATMKLDRSVIADEYIRPEEL